MSPASTGGLGSRFENCVQASFVVLMLSEGVSPCRPNFQIYKLILQGRNHGYKTDDLIVFMKRSSDGKTSKLIGQIKHTIKFTRNPEFQKVMKSAWLDFLNEQNFNEENDLIGLITGPLSATDTNDVRTLLGQAEEASSVDSFTHRIELGKLISMKQRKKYQIIKEALKKANDGSDLTNEQMWRFLKCFRLLIYDLDIKGVVFSLLNSLIGQFTQENTYGLWCQIKDFVGEKNERAGEITLDSIPDEIRSEFERKPQRTIPQELTQLSLLQDEFQPRHEGKPKEIIPPEIPQSSLVQDEIDWNQSQYASELAIANILGSWKDESEADKIIASKLANENFSSWISKLREVLQQPNTPLSLKEGVWKIEMRKKLWQILGIRIFDDNLDEFKQCVVAVLKERDPMFELPPENRFAASVYGKVLKHSKYLRKGLSEGLTLLGNPPDDLAHRSGSKCKEIPVLAVREIFKNADWVIWGSLNDLLPIIAEAAPNEFIKSVESALLQTPCPFDELFLQEGNGVFGRNYLTGLLWALETLAWDEQLLNRISLIFGELASRDLGGNWGNRPLNSLTTIFLPWLPQTTASIKKRNVAVTTLQSNVPEIAWKLLLSLLPKQHQTSSGSRKPIWRESIPEDWSKEVTKKEYWEQVSFYADLAVEMAIDDIGKLKELINYFGNLTEQALEKVLEYLSSEDISARDESELLGIWNELTEFVLTQKRYADPKKHLSPKTVSRIEKIVKLLAPSNPINLHRRLFNGRSFDPYETKGNWQEQYQQLEEKRQGAIKEIFDDGGINAVIQFTETVESPSDIGYSLGHIVESSIDASLLPNLLDTERNKLARLIEGYVRGRYYSKGWIWVDSLDRSGWSTVQIGQFLAYLPFSAETWERVGTLLGDSEKEYWHRVEVKPYQADCNIALAIDKLNEFGKPISAIYCSYRILHDKKPLDITQTIKILLSATKSREHLQSQDAFHIARIIKSLQENEKVNPDDLLVVEWAYLPLLDGRHDVTPKILENRLANDPDYFCEVIRLVYRSQFETEVKKELSKEEQSIAINAGRLIRMWKTPPGMDINGDFEDSRFKLWLESVKKVCGETGHLEVALEHVGHVLINTPPDPDGLWINRTVAEELNKMDSEEMRKGYRVGRYNSRGAHVVDPTGKTENKRANECKHLAEELDNARYPRFAGTLREIAELYDSEADSFARIIEEHTPVGE